ncbi:MAG: hypothetical protein WCT05_07055 [Lentisphaeria bacterium]
MLFVFLLITGACLCTAAVQVLRKQWKKAVIGILSAVLFFLLAVLYMQSLADAIQKAQQTAPCLLVQPKS